MKKSTITIKTIKIILKSASGFVFGQGLYNLFILSLSFLIFNSEIKNSIVELFVFSRLISVISLLGFEKYLLKISPNIEDVNLKIILIENKHHFKKSLMVFFLLMIIMFIFNITNKENIAILFITVPIIALNEMFVYVFRGKKFYILNQFLQFGSIVISFVVLNFLNVNYIYSFSISVFISLITSYFVFRFNFKIKTNPKEAINEKYIISTKFSKSITLGTLIVLLLNGADLFFYKLFFSTNSYEYIVISKLAFISTIPLFIMNNHFVSDIGLYLNIDAVKFKQSFYKNRLFSFIGCGLIVLIFIVCNKYIYMFIDINISHHEFNKILILLLLAQLTSSLVGGVGNILMLGGRENVFMKNNLVILLTSLLAYGILIPRYNLIGLALSNSFLIIFQNSINRISVKKHFNV